ncbi:mitochondrial distribution and morphology family 33, partial [Wallemia mellicola CBS 633.66]
LSGQLNRLTGYERIENLKAVVIKAEQSIKQSRTMLIDSKREYTKYTELRRQSQKQVNDLLSNKSSWGDTELNKFTQLVKSDHSIEKLEKEFMQKVEEYEKLVDRGFEKLLKSILERYHEEQIWSDKIRSMSSNYTLIALSVNVLVFLMAIVFIEPYKRNRMLRELE